MSPTAATRTAVDPSRSPADVGVATRPLLKWAGGKRQLLPEIRRFYPETFGRYLEPFVGSGAVFLDLHNQKRLGDRQSILIDSNTDLIGCYTAVRDRPDAVIRNLRRLAAAHQRDPGTHYYRVRDTRFNPIRRRLAAGPVPASARYTPSLAAMLIYLNRTGYNGLFRLNARGEFNVPIGRYVRPQICDAANVRAVAAALAPPVRLVEDGFARVLRSARDGDFVYIDPPYAPLSRTAHFTAYTAGGFTDADQASLQRVVLELCARGCWVLLSNSTAPVVSRLYDDNPDARAAGLRAHRVRARRAINAKASRRGTVQEYLISNVPRARPATSPATCTS